MYGAPVGEGPHSRQQATGEGLGAFVVLRIVCPVSHTSISRHPRMPRSWAESLLLFPAFSLQHKSGPDHSLEPKVAWHGQNQYGWL